MNMSYCRWNNTRIAMRDCMNAYTDKEEISTEEREQAKKMFAEIIDFMYEEGIVDFGRYEADECIDRVNEMFDNYVAYEEEDDYD